MAIVELDCEEEFSAETEIAIWSNSFFIVVGFSFNNKYKINWKMVGHV